MPPPGKDQTNDDQDQIEQPQVEQLLVDFQAQTAEIVVSIVGGIAVSKDMPHHRPQQHQHGNDGPCAEQHQVPGTPDSTEFFAGTVPAHTVCQDHHSVAEVVSHSKVEIPPPGQDQCGCGKKDHRPAGRLCPVKPVVQCQSQDQQSKDQAKPVRLPQHSGHPHKGEAGTQPHTQDEKQPFVLHIQALADLAYHPRQSNQKGGQNVHQLAGCIGIAGAPGQAERKLG